MEDCLVCRKHRGELPEPGGLVYEDSLARAGHAFLPEGRDRVYLGWLMVEPKRHLPELADLTDDEARAVGLALSRLSRALLRETNAEHIYSFVLGHHVPHLHVHLLPRYPGTPPEYWGLNLDEWPDAPTGAAAEVEALCGRLRAALT